MAAAVKVTDWPLQMVLPDPVEILTAGVIAPEIVILSVLEVALLVVTHCEFETIWHDIAALPVIVLVV